MTLIKRRYLYSLKEVFSGFDEDIKVDFHASTSVSDLVAEFYDEGQVVFPTGSKINDLWQRVCNEFADYGIAELDKKEASASELYEVANKFFNHFINFYFNTNDYYEAVLGAYADRQTHLLDKVKSSSLTGVKFNDTPQNTPSGFDGDSYVSTYTKSEGSNETDFATTMTRLREIQDDYKNTWNDWLNEARRLFIEEVA